MRTSEKAKPQTILPSVDPLIPSAPTNTESEVVTQVTVKSRVSPFIVACSNKLKICMLYSIRNLISRLMASDIICKPIVHLAWCLFVIMPFLCLANVSKIPLTPEETSWLKAKHTVRVRIGNAPPFMITDGEIRGIAIDYLTQIFNHHKIKFSYISKSEVTWPQALKYIAKHDVVDMVPTAKITDERKKHMLFTNEYISAPWVIFTRTEGDFTGSIEDLKGKTVSVEEGYVIQKKLQNKYPEIKLKVVSAQLEDYATIPIRDLSTGLVDAYIGNLLSTTYLIQSMGYTNVKVAAPTPFDNHNQAMAVRDDWPELISIINKTLGAMTPEEHAEIRNQWLSVRYEYGISYTDVFKWILSLLTGASLVVGFVVFWNWRLKKEVALKKKSEADLLKSENRLRSTLDATPFPVAVVDLKDDKIFYWTRNALYLFGHTAPTASEWYQIAYPDPNYRKEVIERWKAFLKIAKTSEHPVNTGEYQITCKDGSVRICELYATFLPDFLIITFSDITERKKAEIFFIEGRAKLKGALESMTDAVFISDADGNIVEFNEAFSTFHRLQSKKECFSALADWPSLLDVYSDDGTLLPLDMWVVSKALRGKQGTHEVYKLQRRDTGETWFGSYNYAPIYNNEGGITGSVVVAHDITEKLQIQAQLTQAQKMEAIGNLAGGIAHEFNNILSIIIGNNELVMEDLPEWSLARKSTEEIRIAGLRARDVVKQLLTFSRQDNTAKKVVNIRSLVHDSMKLIRSSIPANIEIRQALSDDVSPILGNDTQINQIFINLCNNTVDALPDIGGVLEVNLSNETVDEKHAKQYPSLQYGQYIKLVVSDNGIGMDKKTLDRVFEPYFTTKDIGKGTGIGMAVVHGIVERHGGSIIADSHPGQGTTFTIFFPAYEGPQEQETDNQNYLPTGEECILYVDDETSIAHLGKRHLESLGYKAESTTDPFKALEMVKTDPHRFDLVITDMAMPKMTGDQLIVEILKIRQDMPTIICTGYSAKISENEAKERGVSSFAMKPLAKSDLATKVRKVLDETKNKI